MSGLSYHLALDIKRLLSELYFCKISRPYRNEKPFDISCFGQELDIVKFSFMTCRIIEHIGTLTVNPEQNRQIPMNQPISGSDKSSQTRDAKRGSQSERLASSPEGTTAVSSCNVH